MMSLLADDLVAQARMGRSLNHRRVQRAAVADPVAQAMFKVSGSLIMMVLTFGPIEVISLRGVY
jgi:hypothetical protein